MFPLLSLVVKQVLLQKAGKQSDQPVTSPVRDVAGYRPVAFNYGQTPAKFRRRKGELLKEISHSRLVSPVAYAQRPHFDEKILRQGQGVV